MNTHDIEQERQKFEAFMREKNPSHNLEHEFGICRFSPVQRHWDTWQAAIEAYQQGGNAKQRYDEIMKDDTEEPDPIEDLRFFCSLAMRQQDWLDVEPFFDALIADRQERQSEAEEVCYEAYQVVGSLLSDLGIFETHHAEKILDNLSQATMVHDDVLPWPSFDHQRRGEPVAWLYEDEIRKVISIGGDELVAGLQSPETQRLLEDKKRLDWLESSEDSHGFCHAGFGDYIYYAHQQDGYPTVREVIDAAMEKQK